MMGIDGLKHKGHFETIMIWDSAVNRFGFAKVIYFLKICDIGH